MRDLIFTVLILGLVPVSFRRPLIGLLTFSWLAYMRAQDLTWGFARHQRWSFLIAGVTLAGYLAQTNKRFVVMNARAWAMLALTAWVGLSLVFSPATLEYAFSRYTEFVKIIGVALFTTALVTRREHLRILLWVIALSFGFYGVKVGMAGILSGGGFHVLQGPGGMLEDNNDFALALNMGLPLLIQIGTSERNKVLRRWFLAMVPLQVLTILMTHSRGGFLSLVALVLVLIWRSRNRLAAFSVLSLAGFVSLFFMPQSFYDRIATLGEVSADSSAMGRLAAWQTALNMSADNPIFGVGLAQFQANYMDYASGMAHEGSRVAHNAYFQIWAECGTPSLLLYLFLIGASLVSLAKLRRAAVQRFTRSWILNYCAMFEASMVAFVVGSTFINRAHFDLFYHMVAIMVAFEVIAWREIRGLAKDEEVSQGRRHHGEVRVVPRGGFERPPRRSGFRDGTAVGEPA